MKNLTFCFLLLLCYAGSANAQQLRIAYFGENITRYGLRIGVEYGLKRLERTAGNGAIIRNDLYAGLSLGFFRHPDNHLGLTFSPELGWRRTGRRGGVVQAALSPGLIRTFYEAATYRTGDGGALERVHLAGQWGFLPGVSLGVGHDFSVRGRTPLLLFANLHYMRQYPYNRSYLNRAFLEVGIIKK